ncbi:hypothetical protein EI94DRAFT_1162107 [Lactarius quietus]|nr:hypothetical protein EI94DRAFT_1162107 [Lactarius quietus]
MKLLTLAFHTLFMHFMGHVRCVSRGFNVSTVRRPHPTDVHIRRRTAICCRADTGRRGHRGAEILTCISQFSIRGPHATVIFFFGETPAG